MNCLWVDAAVYTHACGFVRLDEELRLKKSGLERIEVAESLI